MGFHFLLVLRICFVILMWHAWAFDMFILENVVKGTQSPQGYCESAERDSGPGFVSVSHELLINKAKKYTGDKIYLRGSP